MLAVTPSGTPPEPGQPVGAGLAELEELFEQHQAQVFRAAYRITGSADDAEDVLQTVFLRLLRREDRPDLSGGAAGYLHRAAVNAALDQLRAKKRARSVDLEDVEDQVTIADSQGPAGHSDRKELAAWLRRSLDQLTPRAAEIFALRYFEGYGNREIAKLLRTSQTSIAVTLHRTRNRLRKELRPLVGEAL